MHISRNSKFNRITIYIIFITFLWFIYFLNIKNTNYWYNFDDSKVVLQWDIIKTYWTLTYRDPLNEKYGWYWLYPQWGAILRDKTIFTRWFFWDKLPYMLLDMFINNSKISIKLQQLISLLIIAIFIYAIASRLDSKKTNEIKPINIVVSLLFLFSPTIISFSNIIFPQLIIWSLFAVCLYFFFRSDESIKYLLICSFFLGQFVWTHFSFILIAFWIGAVVLYKLYFKIAIYKQTALYLMVSVLLFIVWISPSLTRNYIHFWSPLSNYYNSYKNPQNEYIETVFRIKWSDWYYKFSASKWVQDLINFYILNPDFRFNHLTHLRVFVLWMPYSNLLVFLWLVTLYSLRSNKSLRFILIAMLPNYWFMAWLNDYFWYWDPYNIRSSMHRYLFPFFTVISVIWILYIKYIAKKNRTFFLIILTWIFCMIFTNLYPNRLYSDYTNKLSQQEKRNEVAEYIYKNTKNHSIIFVDMRDYWFLWTNFSTFDPSTTDSNFRSTAIDNLLNQICTWYLYMKIKDWYQFKKKFLSDHRILQLQEIPLSSKDYLYLEFKKISTKCDQNI